MSISLSGLGPGPDGSPVDPEPSGRISPAGSFRKLCRTLAEAFDLSKAEVTPEGPPAYFVKVQPPPKDILREELHASHLRVGMGIQTSDADRLQLMGRRAFSDTPAFRLVVPRGGGHPAGSKSFGEASGSE